MDELRSITIYTDGYCDPNPGRGGYGAFLVYGDHEKDLIGGYRNTTNNRKEVMAPTMALKTLKNLHELWNRPVHIETREGGKPRLLSFEGDEAVIKEISASAAPAQVVGSKGAAD